MTPTQKELLAEVERRVADSIMEPGTAELMRKLIVRADNDDEAIKVMQLGTTYKRTGLHFDHRLERSTSDIHYLRRNEALSFHTDDSKPVHRLIIGDNYPALQNLLVQYRSKVGGGDISAHGSLRIDSMLRISDNLESIGDDIYQIALTRKNKLSDAVHFSDDQNSNLAIMSTLVEKALLVMDNNLVDYNRADLRAAQDAERDINHLRDRLRSQHLNAIQKGLYDYRVSIAYSDLYSLYEKLADHVINVSEAISSDKEVFK